MAFISCLKRIPFNFKRHSFVTGATSVAAAGVVAGTAFLINNTFICDRIYLTPFPLYDDGVLTCSNMISNCEEDNGVIDFDTLKLVSSFRRYVKRALKKSNIHIDEEEQQKKQSLNASQNSKKPQANFPTLRARLLNNNQKGTVMEEEQPLVINSNEPIQIDNDLFKGHLILYLKPLNYEDDPYYNERIKNNAGNNTFFFQIQGKFKKRINFNHIYVGAELKDNSMSSSVVAGNIMRKLSGLILNCLATSMGGRGMTYSFGNEKESKPHISFPLHIGMESIIVSKSYEITPILGTSFLDLEDVDAQQILSSKEHFDTDATYSMQFSAASIDLPTWKILYPFEIDLKTFWDDSPVCLVIYAKEDDDNNDDITQQLKCNYLFNLQLEHLSDDVSLVTPIQVDESKQMHSNVL